MWLDLILPGSDPILGATETIDCLLPSIIIDAACQTSAVFPLNSECGVSLSVPSLSVSFI